MTNFIQVRHNKVFDILNVVYMYVSIEFSSMIPKGVVLLSRDWILCFSGVVIWQVPITCNIIVM